MPALSLRLATKALAAAAGFEKVLTLRSCFNGGAEGATARPTNWSHFYFSFFSVMCISTSRGDR